MDSSDWPVRCRLSIVYNEFGILEYYDRHYLEAIDHLTTSIQYNPLIGAYYLSRARARYMIEVLLRTSQFSYISWRYFLTSFGGDIPLATNVNAPPGNTHLRVFVFL